MGQAAFAQASTTPTPSRRTTGRARNRPRRPSPKTSEKSSRRSIRRGTVQNAHKVPAERLYALTVGVTLCFLMLGMYGSAIFRAQATQSVVNIEKLKTQITQLEQERDRLTVVETYLVSPERIEGIAIGRLGMVIPPARSYVRIEKQKTDSQLLARRFSQEAWTQAVPRPAGTTSP